MRLIWTDDVAEWSTQGVKTWTHKPANTITWACIVGGFGSAAVIVALVLRFWRQ